jgi:hypothetical protein
VLIVHLDNATLVHRDTELAHGQTAHSSPIKVTADTAPQWGSSPAATSTTSNGLQSLRQSIQHRGISNDATAVILQSWSAGIPRNNTNRTLPSGTDFVLNGRLIPTIHL